MTAQTAPRPTLRLAPSLVEVVWDRPATSHRVLVRLAGAPPLVTRRAYFTEEEAEAAAARLRVALLAGPQEASRAGSTGAPERNLPAEARNGG